MENTEKRNRGRPKIYENGVRHISFNIPQSFTMSSQTLQVSGMAEIKLGLLKRLFVNSSTKNARNPTRS